MSSKVFSMNRVLANMSARLQHELVSIFRDYKYFDYTIETSHNKLLVYVYDYRESTSECAGYLMLRYTEKPPFDSDRLYLTTSTGDSTTSLFHVQEDRTVPNKHFNYPLPFELEFSTDNSDTKMDTWDFTLLIDKELENLINHVVKDNKEIANG